MLSEPSPPTYIDPRTMSSPLSLSEIPSIKQLAHRCVDRIVFYLSVQQLYGDFLDRDRARRDKLLQIAKESKDPDTATIPMPLNEENVDGLLATWDNELAREPRTFEDHFYLKRIAFSAMSVFNERKLLPYMKDENFARQYSERFNDVYVGWMHEYIHAPSPSPRLPDSDGCPTSLTGGTVKISEAQAQALLNDHRILLKRSFIFTPGTPTEARWKVCNVVLDDKKPPQYRFRYPFETYGPLMDREAVVSHLTSSSLEP